VPEATLVNIAADGVPMLPLLETRLAEEPKICEVDEP
jgi:hypothetical protein